MSVSKEVQITGAVKVGAPCSGTSIGTCVYAISVKQSTLASIEFARTIVSPAAFVDLLANSGITSVTALVLKVTSGSLTVRVTSPAGVDQLFDVNDLLVVSHVGTSTAWTAFAVQGTADIEFMAAGQ